jgi:hypothetical protein
VFVRITSSKSNLVARVWCKRFKTDSNCSFGFNDFVMGYLRDAREEDDKIILMVEITNPLAKEYLMELSKKEKNVNT